ncbi:UDP-glucose 4-epimerase GalE [Candidatus Synechococcus spongiarum]|uniref:UDP-glucose 4-epimerase n=1 Tax=Candidatus Synechococcus spongiarum TaxID=431041 RepID=A0A165B2W2_9SYNE|nr:UDP-glucose 4-epimerase GalE [Candidatus Synechococcus spongiarum]SAY39057.1 UDP-glucose 4-epimerase (EC 5.1.3.2) [Candidatus Synechococcus spongiarum]
MRVLVTGGGGYIGCHTVRALQNAGHHPIVLDNLVHGHRDLVEQVLQVPLVVVQLGDRQQLQAILAQQHVEAVLHFAAYTTVGESVMDPASYYRNNLGDTMVLLEAVVREAQRRHRPPMPLVFSSTCATYGHPERMPISEDCPQQPISPYGRSKWMVEMLIRDWATAYGLPAVILRYFNAAGADPTGDLGEDHTPETHLIPRVLHTIGGKCPGPLTIYGDDYPTPDGTCLRDYIHVTDLAHAHVLGLEALCRQTPGQRQDALTYNLGTGRGHSVREVIAAAEAVTGCSLPVSVAPRRPGDPPVLVAATDKATRELGWAARYSQLTTMVRHAWAWHQHRHGCQVA